MSSLLQGKKEELPKPVEKAIAATTWAVKQKLSDSLIQHFAVLLKFKNLSTQNARTKQLVGIEEQCTDYLMKLKNCRTLHDEKLARLIDLISYLPQHEHFDKLLLSITPVLGTITPKLVPVDLTARKTVERQIMEKKAVKVPLYLQSYMDVSPLIVIISGGVSFRTSGAPTGHRA